MRSPQTIGDELPEPGTCTRHLILAVGDHQLTYFPGVTKPCPDGPRQRDQNFAPSPDTSIILTSPAPEARCAVAAMSSVRVITARRMVRIVPESRRPEYMTVDD